MDIIILLVVLFVATAIIISFLDKDIPSEAAKRVEEEKKILEAEKIAALTSLSKRLAVNEKKDKDHKEEK